MTRRSDTLSKPAPKISHKPKPARQSKPYESEKPDSYAKKKPAGKSFGKAPGKFSGKPDSRSEKPDKGEPKSGKPSKPSSFRGQRPDNTGAPGARLRPTVADITLSNQVVSGWEEVVLRFALSPAEKSMWLDARTQKTSVNEIMKILTKRHQTAIQGLWETFNLERSTLRRSTLTHESQALGYLIGFHLANSARMQELFRRTVDRLLREGRRSDAKGLPWDGYNHIIINDVGSGTGALAQVVLQEMQTQVGPTGRYGVQWEVRLSDLSRAALDIAEAGINEIGPQAEVGRFRQTVEDTPVKRLLPQNPSETLVIYTFGYLWNELTRNREATSKVHEIMKAHATRGDHVLVFVLEPANQKTARDAMKLRDDWTKIGVTPIYPCPKGQIQCPLLERRVDWCYSEMRWNRPEAGMYVDRMLGVDRSNLSAAMYAFATAPLRARLLGTEAEANPKTPKKEAPPQRIVVGRPYQIGPDGKTNQRKRDYLLCGPAATLSKEPVPASAKKVYARGEVFHKVEVGK